MALFIPPIEQLPADFRTERSGYAIVAIVLHGTGGTDSRNTLQHGDGRGVSIHKLIAKSGRIYTMVPDEYGANHAGAPTSAFTVNGHMYRSGAVNKATLGLELENRQDGRDPYTDPQLSAMGWQIAEWRKRYGPLPILRHADLDPTRRRDPYQLTTEEAERWAAKYTTPLSTTHIVHAGPFGAIARQNYQASGKAAAYFGPGTAIEIDNFHTNGYRHASSGVGFLADGDLLL